MRLLKKKAKKMKIQNKNKEPGYQICNYVKAFCGGIKWIKAKKQQGLSVYYLL